MSLVRREEPSPHRPCPGLSAQQPAAVRYIDLLLKAAPEWHPPGQRRSAAERLFLSVNTVRSHLERIRDKTGARRRPELIRYALQAGIEAVAPPS